MLRDAIRRDGWRSNKSLRWPLCFTPLLSKAVVTTTIRLRFDGRSTVSQSIDVKNVFYVFIQGTFFTFLTFFYFANVFF